jgi:hypothetical protein
MRQLLTLCNENYEDEVRCWTRWPQNVRKLSWEMFNKITNTVHKYIIYLQEDCMYTYIHLYIFHPLSAISRGILCTTMEVLKTFRLLIITQLSNDLYRFMLLWINAGTLALDTRTVKTMTSWQSWRYYPNCGARTQYYNVRTERNGQQFPCQYVKDGICFYCSCIFKLKFKALYGCRNMAL